MVWDFGEPCVIRSGLMESLDLESR